MRKENEIKDILGICRATNCLQRQEKIPGSKCSDREIKTCQKIDETKQKSAGMHQTVAERADLTHRGNAEKERF